IYHTSNADALYSRLLGNSLVGIVYLHLLTAIYVGTMWLSHMWSESLLGCPALRLSDYLIKIKYPNASASSTAILDVDSS
ncbi:hypothetical protein ACJX0J_022153, partial [Zea mays]